VLGGRVGVFSPTAGMNSVSRLSWCGVPMVLAPSAVGGAAVARGLRSWGRASAWNAAARRRSGAAGGAGAGGSPGRGTARAIAPLAAGFRAAGGAARAAEKIEETIARKTEEARP